MIEELRALWKASPFMPFDLHLSDGRNVKVPHPDFFSMSPQGGMIVAYDQGGKCHIINTSVLVSVTHAASLDEPSSQGSGERK